MSKNRKRMRNLRVAIGTPAPPPVEVVLEAKPKRPFRARSLPLDGGFDVKITGKDTDEQDIFIQYESGKLVVITGEGAAAARRGGAALLPAAAGVPAALSSVMVYSPGTTTTQSTNATPTRRGNLETFKSSSKLDLDAPDEEEQQDDNVVQMQDNGMPRAPRDRTRAQRAALVIHDQDGKPATQLDPEAIAKA
jgi:hypothetical protein